MSPHPEGTHCETVLDQLEAWVDDDLEAGAAAELESHLEGCPACRAEAALAGEIRDGLRELPRFGTPDVVLARVRAETASQQAEAGRRWQNLPAASFWLAAAALLAVAVLVPGLLGPGLLSPGGEDSAPEMAAIEVAPESFDEAEIERATEEARYAIALVGSVSRRTGLEIRDDLILGRVVRPTAESLSKLKNMRHERIGETNET